MIRKFAAATLSLMLLGAPLAHAKPPCRDAKGKFTKCETPTKPKPCRDAKGKFVKCDATTTPAAPKEDPK